MCNISNIVCDIVMGHAFNDRNLMATSYSTHKVPIIAYFDYSNYHISDFAAKWVVYLIKIGEKYYIGITDCLSRRIQEHISGTPQIVNEAKNGERVLYKVIHIANSELEARSIEERVNTRMQYYRGIHLNKIR